MAQLAFRNCAQQNQPSMQLHPQLWLVPLATYSVGLRERSDLTYALDTEHMCTIPPC